jgi:hypothetical protein
MLFAKWVRILRSAHPVDVQTDKDGTFPPITGAAPPYRHRISVNALGKPLILY